jgi:nucleoside-diphosphate-sugar epimerase
VHVLTRSAEHAATFRKQGLHPIIGDVLNPGSLSQLPEVDTVFWAVGWDKTSGHSMQEVYVDGLENIREKMKWRSRRLIAISSTSVYGQHHGEWVDELSPCSPLQANGQTCLELEQILQNQSESDEQINPLITTVLRLSGIYGPGRLLSRAAALKSGEPLTGNPDAWLNLIHVDDAADAVVKCAMIEEIPEILLVSDDEPIHRRDYYGLLAKLVGAPPPRLSWSESSDPDAPAELNKRCRNHLAKLSLNWKPHFPTFREGLPHAVQTMG